MNDKQNKINQEFDQDEKPYESFQDWLDDISYLKWPMIIMGILVILIIILIQFNIL